MVGVPVVTLSRMLGNHVVCVAVADDDWGSGDCADDGLLQAEVCTEGEGRGNGLGSCLRNRFASQSDLPQRKGKLQGLAVVCQEVVDIEAGTADGWVLVEAGVGTVPVVEVGPGLELSGSLF